jgi:DNA-binding protein HU-beta
MASRPATAAKKAAIPAKAKKQPAKAAAAKQPAAAQTRAGVQKKAAATITLKAVFEQLAEGHDLPRKQGQALLAGMVELVTTHLKNGDRIRMNGLGILEVRDRPARMGRNPATGEAIQVAASKKVAFRPAKELKALV